MADTQELAQEFIDALHALESGEGETDAALDTLVGLYADDATLTNSALRLTGEERKGTDAVRTFWSEYKKTFGKAYSDFHHVAASGDTAGLFWVTKATSPDGKEGGIAYDGTTLLVFNEAGKITFFQGYYDTRQLNRQMGVDEG